MRTFAIKTFSQIAIMAEQLKSFRETVFNKPSIQASSHSLCFSELLPSSIYMVNAKKLRLSFSATSTFVFIMIKDLCSNTRINFPGTRTIHFFYFRTEIVLCAKQYVSFFYVRSIKICLFIRENFLSVFHVMLQFCGLDSFWMTNSIPLISVHEVKRR